MKGKDWREKAVNNLKPYWEVDFKNHQVTLSNQKNLWRRYYLKWFKRFRVKELYAWMQSTWCTQDMMPHPTGIKHDGFKISKDLEKIVPRGYQLQGDWTIPESDLRFLVGGPLLSQDGQRLLVKTHGPIIGFLLFLGKYGNLIGLVLGIASIIITIIAM